MRRRIEFKSAGERLLMLSGVLALILWAVGNQPAAATDEPRQDRSKGTQRGCPEPATARATAEKGESGQSTGAPKGSGGFRVYIDPETGQFGVPPPDAEAPQPLVPGAALSTAAEGLVETSSPEPGGGVMVDLKGRFRSPLIATVGTEGKVEIQHGPCDPGSDPKR